MYWRQLSQAFAAGYELRNTMVIARGHNQFFYVSLDDRLVNPVINRSWKDYFKVENHTLNVASIGDEISPKFVKTSWERSTDLYRAGIVAALRVRDSTRNLRNQLMNSRE